MIYCVVPKIYDFLRKNIHLQNQSVKWKFEFTSPIQILELIYTGIYLNKTWKIYWSEQSFTGIGPEDQCSLWGLHNFFLLNQTLAGPYLGYSTCEVPPNPHLCE
jgi:hypothetical protein